MVAAGGCAAGCVGAYQAEGAATLAASYTNLKNPGTNDINPLVAPTWDAVNGWLGDGATTKMDTGITPTNNQTWSAIVKFSGATVDSQFAFGSQGAGPLWGIQPRRVGYWGCDGLIVAPTLSSGIVGFAGTTAYRNGVAEAGAIGNVAGVLPTIYVCARHQGTDPVAGFTGNVQALAIYNTTLSAGQMAAIRAAMVTMPAPP
jgi:hypothetical protein